MFLIHPTLSKKETDLTCATIEKVMKSEEEDKQLLLVTQKESNVDNPKTSDLYKVGILGNVLQMLKLPDGTVKVLVEGKSRIKISNLSFKDNFIKSKLCVDFTQ